MIVVTLTVLRRLSTTVCVTTIMARPEPGVPRAEEAGPVPARTASTVAAACHSRREPRIPSKKCFGETPVAEQVVVEEVEMASGQAIDLGQGSVDSLGVKRFAG
jgi:hypothetical protein